MPALSNPPRAITHCNQTQTLRLCRAREIERDALNDGVSLAATLRKCSALGGVTKTPELRDWASQELGGYRNDDEVSQYRIIHAPLKIDFVSFNAQVRGKQISQHDLPEVAHGVVTEEVKLAHGSEIWKRS